MIIQQQLIELPISSQYIWGKSEDLKVINKLLRCVVKWSQSCLPDDIVLMYEKNDEAMEKLDKKINELKSRRELEVKSYDSNQLEHRIKTSDIKSIEKRVDDITISKKE